MSLENVAVQWRPPDVLNVASRLEEHNTQQYRRIDLPRNSLLLPRPQHRLLPSVVSFDTNKSSCEYFLASSSSTSCYKQSQSRSQLDWIELIINRNLQT